MVVRFKFIFLIGFCFYCCGNRINQPVIELNSIEGLKINELEVELHDYFINSKLSETLVVDGIIYNIWINNSGFKKYEILRYDAISVNANSKFSRLNELYYPFNDSLVFAIITTPREMFTKSKTSYYVFNPSKEIFFFGKNDTFKLLNDFKKYKQLSNRYSTVSSSVSK